MVSIELLISHSSYGTLSLQLDLNTSILILKQYISTAWNIKPSSQTLTASLRKRQVVLEDEFTLQFYGIPSSALIALSIYQPFKSRTSSFTALPHRPKYGSKYRSRSNEIHFGRDPFESLFEICKDGDYHGLARELECESDITHLYSLEGWTPLHYAAFYGHSKLVELLIESGANVNLVSKNKELTALHLATTKRHKACVETLLKASDLNVNICTKAYGTALHCACQNDDLEIASMLLLAKANYNLRNGKRQLAVDLTSSKKLRELLYRYMGETEEHSPDIFEGHLFFDRWLGPSIMWAVLDTKLGILSMYHSKQDFIKGRKPYQHVDLITVREVLRCKGGFFSTSSEYYFHIQLKNSVKLIIYSENEDYSNLWVRNIFSAALSKQYNDKLHLHDS